LGLENKGKSRQIGNDDICLGSTGYFLCINLEEWMADGSVALQGNGHRQVDGTYSETYTKLFLNMTYKIKVGVKILKWHSIYNLGGANVVSLFGEIKS
jgi:hypothetical protein